MRKTLALLLTLAATCFGIHARQNATAYSILPDSLDGSMMIYDFSKVEALQWPDSLTPRYCGYVARHGARFMTSEKKFSKLEKALKAARKRGKLTDRGSRMLGIMDDIRRVTAGRWGELSPVGIAEERELGTRMARDFKALDGSAAVSSVSSFVPRAMMTMYEFNHAMDMVNDSLEFNAGSGRRYSPLVYCFAYDKEYADYRKHGDWKEAVERYEKDLIPKAPLKRLISDASDLPAKEQRELTLQNYSVLQSLRAMGLPAPTTEWMSVEEYRDCWRISNLTHYLRNNVTSLSTVCAQATAPLLADIIDSANGALATKGKSIILNGWFGHAETLLPLLSVMRIPGCYAMPRDWDMLEKSWQLQNITPLGANLAIYLLQGPSGTIYAAVQLNGRNVEPIPGQGEIVKWSDLSEHWVYLVSALMPKMERHSSR